MALDIEVQEVRRAILTEVMWHRRERRFWGAVSGRGAYARYCGHGMAIASLLDVLDTVRTSARARDAAFGDYVYVLGGA